jgi:hypothetical protein
MSVNNALLFYLSIITKNMDDNVFTGCLINLTIHLK